MEIITCREDLERAVNTYGFLPFFKNDIEGFSVEESILPELWFPDEGEGVWEWKGPVIQNTGCAYGKFYGGKAVYISREWFAEFANYRRDGYDFDARVDGGLVAYQDRRVYEILQQYGTLPSKVLKDFTGYGRGGNKGFDTIITRLQMRGYVLIDNFVYEMDKKGKPYGWGVAVYTTPEARYGKEFTDCVYKHSPERSKTLILEHLHKLLPHATEKQLLNFLR